MALNLITNLQAKSCSRQTELYASFEGQGSISASASASGSCSTSPPAEPVWSQLQDKFSHENGMENELMDINYAQGGTSGRRFSLSCASDAETIITGSQPQPLPQSQAGVSWFGSQFNNSASPATMMGPYSTPFHQLQQHQQMPFLTTSHSMPVLPTTSNTARHTRKRTHDVIDYVPGPDKAIKRGRTTGTANGSAHMSPDVGHLMQALSQKHAQVQAQLSQGQRPPIFDQIYRAQLAHSLALNRASSHPAPAATAATAAAATDAPGSPSEDPMMPAMHSVEQMQAAHASQATSSLLSYNFSQTTPNLHGIDSTHNSGNLASVFYAMQNSADSAALDLADPAMLDRFLGIGAETADTGDSGLGWSR